MHILKIINENIMYNTHNNNFITENKKFLCLSYPNIGDNCNEEAYNKYFDQLDSEVGIYDKTEKLFLETDHIYKIPSNILKFRNLKEIDIRGSRFWDLNCSQIPISIEIIHLIEHSCLGCDCINGMDKLINITTLDLDCNPFNISRIFEYHDPIEIDETDVIPIPNLPNLESITLRTICSKSELIPNWMPTFTNHRLFNNIRDKIDKIDLEDEYYHLKIIVHLS